MAIIYTPGYRIGTLSFSLHYLKTEWNPLFSTMFLGRELGGDAVDLDEDAGLPGGVPGEGNGGEVGRILLDLGDPVAQRHVNLDKQSFGSRSSAACQPGQIYG